MNRASRREHGHDTTYRLYFRDGPARGFLAGYPDGFAESKEDPRLFGGSCWYNEKTDSKEGVTVRHYLYRADGEHKGVPAFKYEREIVRDLEGTIELEGG